MKYETGEGPLEGLFYLSLTSSKYSLCLRALALVSLILRLLAGEVVNSAYIILSPAPPTV